MQAIYAPKTVSVTELKRSFASILSEAGNTPVAVLNHNKAEAYLLSADYYEYLLDCLEDAEDRKLVQERAQGPFVEVDLNAL